MVESSATWRTGGDKSAGQNDARTRHARNLSANIELGSREATPMDLKDRRIWYVVAAVVIVLLIIAYAAGWFGGAPAPAPQ